MNINKRGNLYVVSSPSGGGKTTIVREFMKTNPVNTKAQVSYTSRKKRMNEQDGVDYHFISTEDFKKKIEENFFIEYAEIFGNMYGVPNHNIVQSIENNIDLIFTLEEKGYMRLKQVFPENVTGIFIAPKSEEILLERLKKRNTETEESLKQRISEATAQLMTAKYYDYLVINDNINQAVEEFSCILVADKLRCSHLLKGV